MALSSFQNYLMIGQIEFKELFINANARKLRSQIKKKEQNNKHPEKMITQKQLKTPIAKANPIKIPIITPVIIVVPLFPK